MSHLSMPEEFAKACTVIPGGVSSPVRAFKSVGGNPVFVDSATGPFVYAIDGTRYLDLVGSWGPALLGHAHPDVITSVSEAAAKGLSFGAPTARETELALEIRRRVPGAEKVRFVSTGTEATMTALRLARGATGRDLIVKFAGCYHGHSDGLLAAAGSGVATAGLPGSAGVTAATAGQTIVVDYNDVAALESVFAELGTQIAAVITEAAPCNMGVIPPVDDFNIRIREITAKHGALMIFDEVLTGFRVSPSGFWGLENPGTIPHYVPDLFTFGKVVGGGMPLAAIGGRTEVMDLLAPLGPVYQAGTLSGNPLATAAGLTTLQLATDDVYARIDAASLAISAALEAELSQAGVPHRIQRAGNLFSVFFTDSPVNNYAEALDTDIEAFTRFFWAMHEQQVYLPPSVFEAWFVSAAHSDGVVDQIIAAFPKAVAAVTAG